MKHEMMYPAQFTAIEGEELENITGGASVSRIVLDVFSGVGLVASSLLSAGVLVLKGALNVVGWAVDLLGNGFKKLGSHPEN